MVIRAVVFDIGGVLEITPDLGVDRRWETRLGLPAGEINARLRDVWQGGSVGTITLDDVHEALKDRLGLDDEKLAQFMADLWREYVGTANTELIEYARRLRPRYHTGIVSNSFVGAREREKDLVDLVDETVYSHEIGVNKPDPRAFEIACARLRSRPGDCLFIDDHSPNVEAARAFGMRAVLFTGNTETTAAIEDFLRP